MERINVCYRQRISRCCRAFWKHGTWVYESGDILFLHMSKEPIRAGEIVVFNVDGREIPIVHRVIKVATLVNVNPALWYMNVHILEKLMFSQKEIIILGMTGSCMLMVQLWQHRHHIMGRAVGFLPYVGWVTIIMTEKPIIKYILIGALGLLVITSKE